MTDPEQNYQARRIARMRNVDDMPPAMRALVHDYGYAVVHSFVSCGVTKPKRIKHLVETVLNEMVPTRGAFSSQGGSRGKS